MKKEIFERNIKNLNDNGKVSFKDLKEILNNISNFTFEKKSIPKGNKLLLSYSINNGRIVIKNSNNFNNINEYIKTCDNLKEEYLNILNNLEKNISSLDQEEQVSIFGPDNNVYYSLELYSKPDNCINYNSKHFSFLPDEHGEYNKEGKLIVSEVSRQANKLEEMIKNWETKHKHENYNLQSSAIRKLNELSNKEYYNYASNKLDNCISSANSYINNNKFNLNNDSTIDEYMLSRIYILLNGILEKLNDKINPLIKMNIAKRLLGIRGIGLNDITKNLNTEQEKYIKENILNDLSKNNILKNAIKPIEEIIINYTVEMLKSIQSILLLSDDPSYKRINKQINNSVNYINTANSFATLKNELKSLKYLDKYSDKKKLYFLHDGQIYEKKGIFNPISELLKFFKPFNTLDNTKKLIDENDLYSIINETITKKGNKYCLVSKKNKKNLGCYGSKSGAKKREKQVQYFKHIKEMSASSAGSVQGYVNNKKDLE